MSHAASGASHALATIGRSLDHAGQRLGTSFSSPKRTAHDLGNIAGYTMMPLTYSAGLLGAFERGGLRGGGWQGAFGNTKSSASEQWKNPSAYWSNPSRRGEFAEGFGTAAAVASGTAAFGGPTTGTGLVVSQGATGAVEGTTLSGVGISGGAGGGALFAGGASSSYPQRQLEKWGAAQRPKTPDAIPTTAQAAAPSVGGVNPMSMIQSQQWAQSAGGTIFSTPYSWMNAMGAINNRAPGNGLVGA